MSNAPKRPRDFSQAAKLVIDVATGKETDGNTKQKTNRKSKRRSSRSLSRCEAETEATKPFWRA
jgi:hypothetical protein